MRMIHFDFVQKISMRSLFSVLAYYGLPIVFALLSILFPSGEVYAKMGLASMFVLAFLMFLKPMAILSKCQKLMFLLQFRRQYGVIAFYLALFHGAGLFVHYDLWDSDFLGNFSNHYFYGFVALLGMIILGITSNNFSVRILKKYWKQVHWLAYPTFIFTLLHAGLANGSLALFSLVSGSYALAKYFEWKKNASF